MEALPDSERRQERRFNRKGVVMNIHRERGITLKRYVRYFKIKRKTCILSIKMLPDN
jgi:hypothetical protein